MLDFHTEQASEAQLAALLGELLEGEGAGAAGGTAVEDMPAEIVEMRDVARLLRAASQSVPLPEGRLAVRRALLATVQPSFTEGIPARAAWRRTGRWLGVAAVAAMIVAAFGLGAGLLDGIASQSHPLYGLRLAVDRVRLALIPGGMRRTGSPAGSAQAGIAEIEEFAASGYARTAGISGYPLAYLFTGVTIPSAPGVEVTAQGTVGGLPVTLSLTAAAGCAEGTNCGVFEAWVTPLRGTLASAEFGQLRGTFVCAAGECRLTLVSKTGVFNSISASVLRVNAAGTATGLAGTGFASLGDWVATVERTAAGLKSAGLLPAGVTVADLVSEAATNQSVPKRPPQGKTVGPTTGGGLGGGLGMGVPTGSSAPGVTVGTGVGGGTSAGGGVMNTTTSTSVSGSGVSVSTSGTTSTGSGSVNGSTSTSTSSGSTSTSTSGTTNTSSGSVSGTTSTTTSSGSTSTSTSGTTNTSSGSVSGTTSTTTSSGSTSGTGSVSGGTSSGGGVSVGGGVNVGGGGVGGGGGTGGGGIGGGGGLGGGLL